MDMARANILGNSSIGLFGLTTDKYTIIPHGVKESTLENIEKTLEVPILQTSIANTVLIGTMATGNSSSLFVPPNISIKEYNIIKEYLPENVEIIELDTKYTALGNLIAINDNGAIISSLFEKEVKSEIKDTLDIDVITGELLGSPLVGTMVLCTNKGCLVHPLLSEEEISEIKSRFKVNIDLCTVNRGVPYPKTGLLGNTYGTVIGSDTTGPESMRIFEILISI